MMLLVCYLSIIISVDKCLKLDFGFLKILCRQTKMEEDVYNRLVEKAKEEGYDVGKLKKTLQLDPPPEGDEGPKDTKGIWWIKSLFGK